MVKAFSGTFVAGEQSLKQIRGLLIKHDISGFGHYTTATAEQVFFELGDRVIRMEFPVPQIETPEFQRTPSGRQARTKTAAQEAWKKEYNRLWRALYWSIKAKLDAVEAKITTVEKEFLPYTVCRNGMTVAENMEIQGTSNFITGGEMRSLQGSGGQSYGG